ncbi:MAG: site-2 protease family protein [Candidatus Spechtbacteria bacterium]|nr:site-2 protease family protein [Candidatus Spechtbacteria bacterium]
MEIILFLVILIFSVVVHEVSHGLAANALGDPTARMMGRLTLNPIVHIDPIGSIIVPLMLVISAQLGAPLMLFGWAKPVPYNPYNLSNQQWGPAMVGLAGPAANFAIAIVFGIALRFLPLSSLGQGTPLDAVSVVFSVIVYLNLVLGVFNLMPIPPLDGSKLLFAIPGLPWQAKIFMERYGLILVVMFIVLGFSAAIFPIVSFLFQIITGHPINLFF